MLISLLRILCCSQPDTICLLVVAFCSQKFVVLFVAGGLCSKFGYILCCITISTPSFWVPPALRPSRVAWEAGDSCGLFHLLTILPHPPFFRYNTPFLWVIVPFFFLIIILVGLLLPPQDAVTVMTHLGQPEPYLKFIWEWRGVLSVWT